MRPRRAARPRRAMRPRAARGGPPGGPAGDVNQSRNSGLCERAGGSGCDAGGNSESGGPEGAPVTPEAGAGGEGGTADHDVTGDDAETRCSGAGEGWDSGWAAGAGSGWGPGSDWDSGWDPCSGWDSGWGARLRAGAGAGAGSRTGGREDRGHGNRTARRTAPGSDCRTTDSCHRRPRPGAARPRDACRRRGPARSPVARRSAHRRQHRRHRFESHDRSDIPSCIVPFPNYPACQAPYSLRL